MQILIIILVIVVVAALAFLALGYYRKRRSSQLRDRFGPEYDRAVGEHGDRRAAEPVLLDRQKRVEKLNIIPLSDADRERYAQEWRQVQARFVDDPAGATAEADRLVHQVMEARGYPMGDFEQRVADISVEHSSVVANYRRAHDIAVRQQRGEVDTEDLRKGIVYYRSLFEDLLEKGQTDESRSREAKARQ